MDVARRIRNLPPRALLATATAAVLIAGAGQLVFAQAAQPGAGARYVPIEESLIGQLPPAKRALVEQNAAAAALAASTRPQPPKSAPNLPGPVVRPTQAPPIGIVQEGQYPGNTYRFSNQWVGTIGGRATRVYAGSLANDSRQGVVLVDSSGGGRYLAPPGTGGLKIIDKRGDQLTLAAESESTVVFDLAARVFVPN